MTNLNAAQEATISKIDAVIAILNADSVRKPTHIKQGMKAIHSAIASKP